jgi:arginine decarboxylase
VCNGFKTERYMQNIADLIHGGFTNVLPVIDNFKEWEWLQGKLNGHCNIGIRIASEEEPKFEFYTSRLGIGYKHIAPFYKNYIANNPKVTLTMLHFFVNTGIHDTAYYWSEFTKCLRVYVALKKICPTLKGLNIGGGLPVKDSLAFEYDYAYMINEIVSQTKAFCNDAGVEEPDLYTEFGSYTVSESGANIYSVLYQKQQNDREKWNIIDSSFMTTLPDTWGINRKFIMLPVNHWEQEYERIFLGGLTCDSDDYYNSEQHVSAIYLPKYTPGDPLFIGFFNTGAYQDNISGFGGIQHCLIPKPKHILIDRNEQGELTTQVFAEEQSSDAMMRLLGYQ